MLVVAVPLFVQVLHCYSHALLSFLELAGVPFDTFSGFHVEDLVLSNTPGKKKNRTEGF
jgi:hypothetical protein